MRKVLVASFCVLLLILMVQSHSISMQSENQVELDDSVSQYTSSKSISTGALAWEWAQKVGGSSADDHSNAIAIDANGDVYVTGSFEQTATFGSTTLSSAGDFDIFVAKMNSTGHWLWAIQAGGNHDDRGLDLAIDTSGNVFVTGKFQSTVQFGSDSLTAGPTANDDFFIAKADTWGNWLWVEGADCHNNGRCYGASVAVDSAGYAYVTGSFTRDIDFGSTTLTWAGVEDIFVAKIDTWGSWQWATMAGGAQGSDTPHSIDIGPQGNAFIAGSFRFTSTFGTQSMTASGSSDAFIAKISQQGDWLWAHGAGGTSSSGANSIRVDSQGNVFAAGSFYIGISFGNLTYSAGSTENSFIAKANDQGNSATWEWALQLSSSSSNSAQDLSFDANENLLATGEFRGTASFGNSVLTSSGNQDVYVASILANGNWNWARIAGSGGEDVGLGIEMDSLGGLYVTGSFLQNTITFGTVDIATSGGFDSFISKMSSDFDQDSLPDSLDDDDDGDYVLDAVDRCNPSPFGFESLTSTDHDGDGCRDADEDLDDDDDGMLDENDECPRGMTGWIPTPTTDIDSDGCLDSIEDYDDDNDGYEDYMDLCPRLSGNSTYEFEEGCPDTDGDGRADVKDPFPNNAAEWEDTDRDGVGNNSDAFPDDPTQILDTDGDNFGDHPFGNFPDECPDDYGTSYIDVYGCVDSDSDGVSDLNDQFPNNPDLWQDSDRDGIEDDIDAFPYNPGQWLDSDGDGFGDNPMDANADKFPNDSTQWSDVDGDGYGDNPSGNMSDAFPLDPTQWLDSDGDGYGDNPSGNMPDAFPLDPTQWIDLDGDGLGDNQSGQNHDPFLFDSDNDGYNNSEDPLPMYPTPGDRDNDGYLDHEDWDPYDINEWKDTDGDGTGDNADADDDGDGWDDWDEMRANTDPYDPNDKPVEGWELAITDNIALSAWDLLALASGFPLAIWIIFGLVTRNARTEAYEERMRNAKTREDLEEVATEYERSLMIRLIGPHQGIRLERVRAELDDEIEMSEATLTGDDDDIGPVVTTPDQTDYTEEELGLQPPEDAEIIVDEKGYEWVDKGEEKWYRHRGDTSWIKWET